MIAHPELFEINFEKNQRASAVYVNADADLGTALARLGLGASRPAIVLVGGTARLSREILFHLEQLFSQCIAPLAERLNAYIVDGGTEAGVIQMMGDARIKIGGTFPLIGVVAEGTAILPGQSKPGKDAWRLDPNHTHFVFVPGSNWGDEVDWIARAASVLSGVNTSATVLVNGGEIAYKDVGASVRAGRVVLIAEGSGRTADALAGALRGEPMDDRASLLVRSGLLRAVNIEHGPAEFARVLAEVLGAQTR